MTALDPHPRLVGQADSGLLSGARAIAFATWLATTLVTAIAITGWLGRGAPILPASYAGGPVSTLTIVLCALLSTTLGAFLANRIPRNPVGWLLLIQGFVLTVVLPVSLAVADSLEVLRPAPTVTIVAAWLASTFVTPVAVGTLTSVMLLFPDGRPASRRWAFALLVPITGTTLLVLGSALDPTMVWYPMLATPIEVPSWGPVVASVARLAGVAALAVAVVLAACTLVHRYRHRDPGLRRQLRWIVLDGALLMATVTPLLLGRYVFRPGDGIGELLVVIATLGASTFPVVVAIAITRSNLFDIDGLIGRTLVYVPLTAILAGTFAATVALLQRLFMVMTGDTSDVVMVLSTLLLAAVSTPIKGALDGFVDRRFSRPLAAEEQPRVRSADDVRSAEEQSSEPASARASGLATLEARIRALEERLAAVHAGPPGVAPTGPAPRTAKPPTGRRWSRSSTAGRRAARLSTRRLRRVASAG
jgi:hypothetical protein